MSIEVAPRRRVEASCESRRLINYSGVRKAAQQVEASPLNRCAIEMRRLRAELLGIVVEHISRLTKGREIKIEHPKPKRIEPVRPLLAMGACSIAEMVPRGSDCLRNPSPVGLIEAAAGAGIEPSLRRELLVVSPTRHVHAIVEEDRTGNKPVLASTLQPRRLGVLTMAPPKQRDVLDAVIKAVGALKQDLRMMLGACVEWYGSDEIG